MKQLRFAKDFTKLNDDSFSTLRPRGKFEVGDDVMVGRPSHDPRQGKVTFIFSRVIDEIPSEFLAHDTDTSNRDEAIAVLRSFYPDLKTSDIWDIVRVKYTGPPDAATIADNIRVDCYMAILARMQQENPDAHFEIITRRDVSSPLSPSWHLLMQAKNEDMSFEEYGKLLLAEIKQRPTALALMQELYELARKQTVFLVCMEKDPGQCHRSLVKKWMMDLARNDGTRS